MFVRCRKRVDPVLSGRNGILAEEEVGFNSTTGGGHGEKRNNLLREAREVFI